MQNVSDSVLLRVLLASSSDAVIVCSPAGEVIDWNATAERLLGHSLAEVRGRLISQFVRLERELPSGALEVIGIRKGEQQVSLRGTCKRIEEQGAELGSLWILRSASARPVEDETPSSSDRRRYQRETLQLNEALDAARLGGWSWDAGTDAVTLSARAAEVFGVPEGVLLSWAEIRDRIHPEDREKARIAVERATRERIDYFLEYRVVSSGRDRWVSASGRPRYDAQGDLLGMHGVVHDVSGDRLLVRVDDAVRPLVASEDITFTAARVLGQYLGVNRCAYAFVEDDEDTFILTGNYNDGVESIVGRYRFRQFGAECLRLMRAGLPYVVSDSFNDPRIDEDDRRSYELTEIRAVICVPTMKSGRFVSAMAVHMNRPREWSSGEVELVQQVASRCWESIERARVERERQSLFEAAEAANRAKDEFLAMLGHELRNPLAPILTALHLMKLRGGIEFERERTVIERQVNHLIRLVDDLLDVSRIARGKVGLKSRILELSEVVADAIEVASPLLEERAHTLTREVPAVGLTVLGDPARLTQVVSNLLTNAGKYTPPSGRIHIAAERSGSEVVLRVRDNGIGIQADVLPRVFEMFVQGRQAIDRAEGGLGLGLAIVKNLVERHGGTVSAHSDGPGSGAEFLVRLPWVEGPTKDLRLPAESSSTHVEKRTAKLRVLVVDDNEDAADMLTAALTELGCEVFVAHDGPAALKSAEDRLYDAALVDIGLPVMDGYELAARLRQLPTLQAAKLVAVTGYGQDSDRQRTRAAGFGEHLVKPVSFSQLEALVARLGTASS